MGMKRSADSFTPYFLVDGYITNTYGENVEKSRRFDDVIDADYWLHFESDWGQFGSAYIETDEWRRDTLFINLDGGENHYVAAPSSRRRNVALRSIVVRNPRSTEPRTRRTRRSQRLTASKSDPTVAAIRHAGSVATLDAWLLKNFIDPADAPDAELLEVIPAEFREEYEKRFEKQRRSNDEQS